MRTDAMGRTVYDDIELRNAPRPTEDRGTGRNGAHDVRQAIHDAASGAPRGPVITEAVDPTRTPPAGSYVPAPVPPPPPGD